MSAESTLYGWLNADAALAALVGERIYPDVIPGDEALPAIAYARTGTEPVSTIHGAASGEFVALEVQCWAATRTAADAVAEAVATALQSNGEIVTDRTVLFDSDTGNFGTSLGVRLLIV